MVLAFAAGCLVACGDGGSASSNTPPKSSSVSDQLRATIESQCGTNCSGTANNPTGSKLSVAVQSLKPSETPSSGNAPSQLRSAVKILPTTTP